MTLIPPLARTEPYRLTGAETSYGNEVRFKAPCPCGQGDSWWIATRGDGAFSHPQYDIRCKHKESHV